MKILLVGDSWGCGEWDLESRNILHGGLAQYLNEDGHEVNNLSRGGISNLDIVHRIATYYDRDFILPHDLVLVFQTEYCRDHKHDAMQTAWGSQDWHNTKTVKDLSDQWLGRFYQRLSEISIKYQVPVHIIGGCSDGIAFDDMSQDYPGCHMLCQSATNLLINGEAGISEPVFSWYTKNTSDLVSHLRGFLDGAAVTELMRVIDLGFQRESLLRENPALFWPDGIHPNRWAHQKIFQFIKSQGVLG